MFSAFPPCLNLFIVEQSIEFCFYNHYILLLVLIQKCVCLYIIVTQMVLFKRNEILTFV